MRGLLRRERQVVRQCLTALCLVSLVLCYINTQVESEGFTSDIEQMVDGAIETKDDNPILIKYIQNQMKPPATNDKHLNLSKPIHTGQTGQAEKVLEYFGGKTGGVFIEAGAWDGEYLSNTLFLEATANWTGLLVEPNIGAFRDIQQKNRKAHSINACLAVTSHPAKVEFDAADVFGGIAQSLEPLRPKPNDQIFDFSQVLGFKINKTENMNQMRNSIPAGMRSMYPVQAYPLYSLILAMGVEKVDFLSLDVEGAEVVVLNTVPWDKVDIELIMVEVEHSDRRAIKEIMRTAGYKRWRNLQGVDFIYKKIRN